MANTQNAIEAAIAANVNTDELDALLGELDVADVEEISAAVSDITVEEVIEEVIEAKTPEISELVASEEVVEDALAELDLEEAKQEIYANSESTGDVQTEAAPEAAAKAPKAAKTPKAPKTPAAPRKSVEDLDASHFVLDDRDDTSDTAKLKAEVMAKRPAQKKVAEKFDNLLMSIASGKKPSTFTLDAYAALKAKGEMTSSELVAVLTSAGFDYSIGTARSQAGQMMALLPNLKVAERDAKVLKLNAHSTIAKALDGWIAAA